jgi:arylsulfatase A-like enzyme
VIDRAPARTAALIVVVVVLALGGAVTSTPTAGASTSVPSATSSAVRPNIVFILTDDLDATTYDPAQFPELNQLMTSVGLTFSRFYVDDSLCCPSRSTILRGQYVHNTGVLNNTTPTGGFQKFHAEGDENSTIATWLHARGYRTGLFGKYLNGYPATVPREYIPPGWDTWVSPSGGNPYGEYRYELNDNGKLVEYGNQPSDYLVDVLGRKATQFIASVGHRPFFAYIAPYVPHEPATPAPRYVNAFPGLTAPHPPSYDQQAPANSPAWLHDRPPLSSAVQRYIDILYRRRMQDMLSVDDLLREVVDTLRSTGQLNNTYIFLGSDNGFHLGQHRLPPGKETAFDEDIRVPLVVRGPGVPHGTTSAMGMNTDLAPTFAALAGAKVPRFVDGRSLVPVMHSGTTPKVWRRGALIEHYGRVDVHQPGSATTTTQPPSRFLPTSPVAPSEPDADEEFNRVGSGAAPNARLPLRSLNAFGVAVPEYKALRTGRYLLVQYTDGQYQLFDTTRDPYELVDLSGPHAPPVLGRLSRALSRLGHCRAGACRRAEDSAPP